MRYAILLAVVTAALAAPASAQAIDADLAATLDRMYPGRTPATDARSHGLQGAAFRYWRRVGVRSCPVGVEFFWSDLEGRAWGEAQLDSCWATLDREYVFDYARGPRRDYTRWGYRYWAAQECGMWAHELGHALGLDHDAADRYPVMQEIGFLAVPRECWRTARKWYGPKKRR